MADKKETKKSIRPVNSKKAQTVRERASKAQTDKPRRIRKTASKVATPLAKARKAGKKEVYLPLPDNKAGRFLNKKVRLVPAFFSEAFAEIRQVTWPGKKDTLRLTLAVFVFAVIFSIFVGFLDFLLDKLFREFIIN